MYDFFSQSHIKKKSDLLILWTFDITRIVSISTRGCVTQASLTLECSVQRMVLYDQFYLPLFPAVLEVAKSTNTGIFFNR